MTPTAKAMELLEPLRQGLDEVRATVVSHRNFDPAEERKLTVSIACTDYLQAAVVKPLVVELRMRAPGVRVALRNLDLTQLDAQMVRGDVDLALMTPQAASPSFALDTCLTSAMCSLADGSIRDYERELRSRSLLGWTR